MAHRFGVHVHAGGGERARGEGDHGRVVMGRTVPSIPVLFPGLLSFGLLSFSSCSPDSPALNAPVVRDSAGVAIVENTGSAWTEESRWRMSEQPVLVLGGSADDPDGQLWQVFGLARLSDGRIVVLNAGSGELRFFDASGRLVARAGRMGGGPGEFQYPLSLDRIGEDTLVALDRTGDRLFFSSQGAFLREETMNPGKWMSLWGPDFGGSFKGVLPDHSLLASLGKQPKPGEPYPTGPFRPIEGLATVRPDLSDTTHVAWYGGIQQEMVFRWGPYGSPWWVVPPFAASTSWGYGGSPVRIIVADNAACEFRIHALTGALERIVRWTGEREDVKAWEVEAWKDEQRSASWTRGYLPLWERAWAAVTVPEKKPAYDWAFLDRESNTWVLETADVGASALTFTVFDAEGRMLGQVEVPAGLSPATRFGRLLDVGPDYFLGVWLDEYEVETVRMYRLVKPEG